MRLSQTPPRKNNGELIIAEGLDLKYPQMGVICNPYTFSISYKPEKLPGLTCALFQDNAITPTLEFPNKSLSTQPLDLTYIEPVLDKYLNLTYVYLPIKTSYTYFHQYGYGEWSINDAKGYANLSPTVYYSDELTICTHNNCISISNLHPKDIGFLIHTLPSDQIASCPSNATSIFVGEEKKCITIVQSAPVGHSLTKFIQFPPSPDRKHMFFLEPTGTSFSGFQLTVIIPEEVEIDDYTEIARAHYEIKAPLRRPLIADNCQVHNFLALFQSVLETTQYANFRINGISLPSNDTLLFTTPSRAYGLADTKGLLTTRYIKIEDRPIVKFPIVLMDILTNKKGWSERLMPLLKSGYRVIKRFPTTSLRPQELTKDGLQEIETDGGNSGASGVETQRKRWKLIDLSSDEEEKGEDTQLDNPRPESRRSNEREEDKEIMRTELTQVEAWREEEEVIVRPDNGVTSEGATHTQDVVGEKERVAELKPLEGVQEEEVVTERQEKTLTTVASSLPTAEVLPLSDPPRLETNTQESTSNPPRKEDTVNTKRERQNEVSSSSNKKQKGSDRSPSTEKHRKDTTVSSNAGNTKKETSSRIDQRLNGMPVDASKRGKNQSSVRKAKRPERSILSDTSDEGSDDFSWKDKRDPTVTSQGNTLPKGPSTIKTKKLSGNVQQKKYGGEKEEAMSKSSSDGKGPYVVGAVLVVVLLLFFFFRRRVGRSRRNEKKQVNAPLVRLPYYNTM